MLRYYAWLAWRSLRRNPVLTGLMVLAIGIGIGASVTTITVLHVLSGDPLPSKSDVLFYPQLDPEDATHYQEGDRPPDQLTYVDAMNLLRDARGKRQAAMSGGGGVLVPDQPNADPYIADLRFSTPDIFALFDIPFLYGSGWSAEQEDGRARVVVLSRRLNQRLFGGENSVGQEIRLGSDRFRVIGVIDEWRPNPHFYDLTTGPYADSEEAFLPLHTSIELEMARNGDMTCFGDGRMSPEEQLISGNCMWLQYWVELESPEARGDFERYLANYSETQREAGRFERSFNGRLMSVMEWLDYKRVVPDDVQLQVWIALGFLVVCIVNTIGLMLAKFLRRAGDIGVRRALGATPGSVFTQYLLEAGMIGLAGAVVGLGLSLLGLLAVRMQPVDYAGFAQLDLPMFGLAVGLSLLASLAAGVLPAWQACRIAPALQLKSE
ncbi:MAG: ABC transporter permease [Abyssibacter sp.]|nr:ABC transporter permease [Abyssibacter sp.]MBB85747.1 ABC transporter ATP-binding protein [Xanthomonadales bacterium]MCK5857949.1 ABC transporter permease [Abyssibacter sp.]